MQAYILIKILRLYTATVFGDYTAPLRDPVALKIFTGSAKYDLKFTGNPILVTRRASSGCTSSTGRAEELPVPYQILSEGNASTQFSIEFLSLYLDRRYEILMVTRSASDITLRLEGRYGVKETVEY